MEWLTELIVLLEHLAALIVRFLGWVEHGASVLDFLRHEASEWLVGGADIVERLLYTVARVVAHLEAGQ